MTMEEFTELFEIQVRGTMATAFAHAGISPGEYWPMIRGEVEPTMRAIGEVGCLTGYNMHLQLSPFREDRA